MLSTTRFFPFALLVVLLTTIQTASAQREVMYEQYIENPMAINPGYTGIRKDFNMSLLFRRRWISIPNVPVSQTFAADGTIANGKVGLGIIALNDRMSPFTTTGINLSGSYIFTTKSGWRMSIGGQGGFNVLPYYSNNFSGRKVLGSTGVGFWAQNEKFHWGVSKPELLTLDYGNYTSSWKYNAPTYGTFGAQIDLNEDFKAIPNVTVKLNNAVKNEIHIGSKIWYHNQVGAGFYYRSGVVGRIHFLAEAQIGNNVRLGYTYDSHTVETGYTTVGTAPKGMHQLVFKFVPNPTRFNYY